MSVKHDLVDSSESHGTLIHKQINEQRNLRMKMFAMPNILLPNKTAAKKNVDVANALIFMTLRKPLAFEFFMLPHVVPYGFADSFC